MIRSASPRTLPAVAAPFLLLALALGACSPQAGTPSAQAPRYVSLDAFAASPAAGSAAVAPAPEATPVAVLPDWIGRPVRLRERDGADAFEQAIGLSLPAKGDATGNLVAVAMPRSEAGAPRGETAAPMSRPTEAGIRAEIDAAFPGVAMQVVPKPGTNAYGTYGLAVGRSERGARCLYAWQWIEDAPVVDGAAVGRGPVSLRVRLCRDDVTLEAMAAAVNQLRLVPPGRGVPVAGAVAPVERTRTRVRSSHRPVADAPRREDAGPTAERRAAAREPRARPVPAQGAAPVATASASAPAGRRYLGADGPVEASPPAYGAPATAGLRSALAGPALADVETSSAPVTGQLPPEAYRGPSVSNARENPR